MQVVLTVPAPDPEGNLATAARDAWKDLGTSLRNPLGDEHTVNIETMSDALPAIAMARPFYAVSRFSLPDRASFLLSEPLLTTASDDERRLSLLHECIHMDFAFGLHRERWIRIQNRVRDTEAAIRQMPFDTAIERLNYLDYRKNVALKFLTVPDEIVAEQRLQRDYPEWFARRAEYYVQMRNRHEAEILAGHPDDVLWPFSVFYELLRISFFQPLVAGIPAPERDLGRLATQTEERLRTWASPELLSFLLDVRPALLDVVLDRQLTGAEAAYDRLFERIMATEPRRSSVSEP